MSIYNNSRRQFIADTGKTTVATGLGIFTANTGIIMSAEKRGFIHHVFFWLKNTDNAQDFQQLVKGLKTLSKAATIREFHIGKPADTHRDVIERSYSVSWMLVFDTKEDQDKYQTDPIHLNFVEKCKDLWSKVVVYDSEEVA